MPGQMSQVPSDNSSPEQQISQLNALLVSLGRTRDSLPSLLAAVSSSTSASPADRAQTYRQASTECTTAVRALGEQLDALEGVLRAAEQSAQRDPTGIVTRPQTPKQQPVAPAHAERTPWAALGDILSGGESRQDKKGKGREVCSPEFDPPTTPDELTELARKWSERHSRLRVRIADAGRTRPPRELRVVLKGVLQATVVLRWEDRVGEGGKTCEADFVMCHGLGENVRSLASSLLLTSRRADLCVIRRNRPSCPRNSPSFSPSRTTR